MSGEMQVLLFDDVATCGPHDAPTPLPYVPASYAEPNQSSWLMSRPLGSLNDPAHAMNPSASTSYPDYKSNMCRSSSPTSHPALPRSPAASTSSEDSSDVVDLSKMSKAELRKHKNRESAARSRKRSRERMQYLETLVRELRAKNRHLEQTVQMLSTQQQQQQQRMPWPASQAMPSNDYHRAMLPQLPTQAQPPQQQQAMMGMSYYDPTLMQH